jgi:hypothetical protein
MYKNLVNSILYWISIVFLIVSIYVYIFYNEDFTWQSLFGTDGLTFFGIIVALISMLSMKVVFFRKCVSWVLLKLNFSQLDYSFEVILEAPSDFTLEDFKRHFFSAVSSSGSIKDNTYNVNYNSTNTYRLFHRGLASNVSIKKIPSTADFNESEEDVSQNLWKIENDGVTQFRIVERNLRFFTNSYLEYLNNSRVFSNKVVLKISKRNTEFNFIDKGILIDRKKYKINRSNIDILSEQNTYISLNSDVGITLTAKNKGDFNNAFHTLKNILIS